MADKKSTTNSKQYYSKTSSSKLLQYTKEATLSKVKTKQSKTLSFILSSTTQSKIHVITHSKLTTTEAITMAPEIPNHSKSAEVSTGGEISSILSHNPILPSTTTTLLTNQIYSNHSSKATTKITNGVDYYNSSFSRTLHGLKTSSKDVLSTTSSYIWNANNMSSTNGNSQIISRNISSKFEASSYKYPSFITYNVSKTTTIPSETSISRYSESGKNSSTTGPLTEENGTSIRNKTSSMISKESNALHTSQISANSTTESPLLPTSLTYSVRNSSSEFGKPSSSYTSRHTIIQNNITSTEITSKSEFNHTGSMLTTERVSRNSSSHIAVVTDNTEITRPTELNPSHTLIVSDTSNASWNNMSSIVRSTISEISQPPKSIPSHPNSHTSTHSNLISPSNVTSLMTMISSNSTADKSNINTKTNNLKSSILGNTISTTHNISHLITTSMASLNEKSVSTSSSFIKWNTSSINAIFSSKYTNVSSATFTIYSKMTGSTNGNSSHPFSKDTIGGTKNLSTTSHIRSNSWTVPSVTSSNGFKNTTSPILSGFITTKNKTTTSFLNSINVSSNNMYNSSSSPLFTTSSFISITFNSTKTGPATNASAPHNILNSTSFPLTTTEELVSIPFANTSYHSTYFNYTSTSYSNSGSLSLLPTSRSINKTHITAIYTRTTSNLINGGSNATSLASSTIGSSDSKNITSNSSTATFQNLTQLMPTQTKTFENRTTINLQNTESMSNSKMNSFHNSSSIGAISTSAFTNTTSTIPSHTSQMVNSTSDTTVPALTKTYPTRSSNISLSSGNVIPKITSRLDVPHPSRTKSLVSNVTRSFRHGGLPKIRSMVFQEQRKSLELEMTPVDNSDKVKRDNVNISSKVDDLVGLDTKIQEPDSHDIFQKNNYSASKKNPNRLLDKHSKLINRVTPVFKIGTVSTRLIRSSSKHIKNGPRYNKVLSSILLSRDTHIHDIESDNSAYPITDSNIMKDNKVNILSDSQEVIFEGISQRIKLNIFGFMLFIIFLVIM